MHRFAEGDKFLSGIPSLSHTRAAESVPNSSQIYYKQSVILSLSKDQFRRSFNRMRDYFVYILSNNSQVLYSGMTSDLDGRLFEHVKDRQPTSFAARYNLDRLVFYETYPTPGEAIAREKQLKGWNREKKKRLIQEMNPMWRNLLDDLKTGMMELPDDGGRKGKPN